MSALSKRVDKLDQTDTTRVPIILFAQKGEASHDAIVRSGYDPEDANSHYMVIQFVSPEETRNGRA